MILPPVLDTPLRKGPPARTHMLGKSAHYLQICQVRWLRVLKDMTLFVPGLLADMVYNL